MESFIAFAQQEWILFAATAFSGVLLAISLLQKPDKSLISPFEAGKLAARYEASQRVGVRLLAVAFEPGLDRLVKDRGQRRRIGTHGRSLAKNRAVSGTNRAEQGSPGIRAGPTPASTPAHPG